jgi:hypothetical protein
MPLKIKGLIEIPGYQSMAGGHGLCIDMRTFVEHRATIIRPKQ